MLGVLFVDTLPADPCLSFIFKYMSKLAGVVILSIMSGALLTSCGENVTPEKVGEVGKPTTIESKAEAPKVYKVGDKVKLNDQILTIVSAADYVPTAQYAPKPKSGMKFYAVEAEVENIGQQPNDYNVFFFKLEDSNSYSYNTAFMGKEPAFNSGKLQPTKKARGFITFEVPVDAKGLELTYTPSAWDASQARIQL